MLNRKKQNKILLKLVSVVLLVIISLSLVLFSCIGDKKVLVGYDIELAEKVSEKLGISLHTKEINWDNKILELRANSIQAIWNGMTITEELKNNDNIIFSQPYLKNQQAIIIKKDKDISTLEELKKLKISVERTSAAINVLKNNGITELQEFATQAQAIQNVNLGISDAAVVDGIYGSFLINNKNSDFYGKLKLANIKDFTANEELFGIAFYKNNDYLAYRINKELYNLYKDGTMKNLATKYGISEMLINITDPGDKKESDFSKESINNYEKIKKTGLTIGITYYEPIAYEVDKK